MESTLDNKLMNSASEKLQRLSQDPNCRFVTSSEFCSLLISRCHFERSDEKDVALAGLRDKHTGHRFFISFEHLGVYR